MSENVLAREFTASQPNPKWAMDISFIPPLEGWVFLARVVDLFSSRIAGWAMDATMIRRRVVDALAMAVGRRGAGAGLIAHSDRGSQYASEHYQTELARHQLVGSMSGVGQCWDTAVIESTCGQLKAELLHGEQYRTRDEAKASIFESIEAFYTRVRRHSTRDYLTPDEFERTHNRSDRSLTVHFPFGRSCSPVTVVSPWYTPAGTTSSLAAHLNARRMRPTRWLISFRDHFRPILFCRTAFGSFGPNSPAGVCPYRSRTRRNVCLNWGSSFVGCRPPAGSAGRRTARSRAAVRSP